MSLSILMLFMQVMVPGVANAEDDPIPVGPSTVQIEGSVDCVWSNPNATDMEKQAGSYQFRSGGQHTRLCQRPVRCSVRSKGKPVKFETMAKCNVEQEGFDPKKGCDQDPNLCIRGDLEGPRGAKPQQSNTGPSSSGS